MTTTPTRRTPPRQRPSPWFGALLAFALLCGQTLGWAHRIAHAPGSSVVATAAEGGGFDFGHERLGLACQLLDQLALGDALATAAVALALLPAATSAPVAPAGASVARCVASYQARAPPHA
jgi:hypothetical protein